MRFVQATMSRERFFFRAKIDPPIIAQKKFSHSSEKKDEQEMKFNNSAFSVNHF